MTTKSIANYLEKDIFFLFGVPEEVISDNGTQLVSNTFKRFFENYGI
jgi:phage portal protein BeeE